MKLQGLKPATLLKETLIPLFTSEYCETFKNTYFEEHPKTAASIYKHSSRAFTA